MSHGFEPKIIEAVVKVNGGRGFIIEHPAEPPVSGETVPIHWERLVITAA
jgi:hypothetical protein